MYKTYQATINPSTKLEKVEGIFPFCNLAFSFTLIKLRRQKERTVSASRNSFKNAANQEKFENNEAYEESH